MIFYSKPQTALQEIHFAANVLRTALEAYEASEELLAAATLNYEAAQNPTVVS